MRNEAVTHLVKPRRPKAPWLVSAVVQPASCPGTWQRWIQPSSREWLASWMLMFCWVFFNVYLCRQDLTAAFVLNFVNGSCPCELFCVWRSGWWQKTALLFALLKPGPSNSFKLEGSAGAVERNRWFLFLNLQCFFPFPHSPLSDETISFINSSKFCKQSV